MFKRRLKTNAESLLESLELQEQQAHKDSMIDLYPKTYTPFTEDNEYIKFENRQRELNKSRQNFQQFQETVMDALVYHCLFDGMLRPVLEADYANNHQLQIGSSNVWKFVQEEGSTNLYNRFRNKNIYLNEFANCIDYWYPYIVNEGKCKMKEGLSEKDALAIEDGDINNFVFDIKKAIPNDVNKIIQDRVSDSITDFIDENKRNKAQVEDIYNKAKEQMTQYNDPMIQQEAFRMAKSKENSILNKDTNVFGSMAKIMVESVHKIDVLKEAYTDNNRLDFKKVLDDTKVMYTFLECLNTLNIMDINESTLTTMLNDMKKSINEVAVSTNIKHHNPHGEEEENDLDQEIDTSANSDLNIIANKYDGR